MKTKRMSLISLAGVVVLCLIMLFGYGNVTGQAQAAPPGDEPTTIDPSIFEDMPVLQAVDPNDWCGNAETIAPLLMLTLPGQPPPPPPTSYSVTESDRKFWHGGNVDDWYMYRTHDLGCPMYYMLTIELVSDKPQVEVELYENCHSWPLLTSMWKETIHFDPEGEGPTTTTVEPLSGLGKRLELYDTQPNHEYYIHVNCLGAPEGGPITYTLEVEEWCMEIT